MFEKILDLGRKLSPKWGVGRHSVVGPLSRGYGICYMYVYISVLLISHVHVHVFVKIHSTECFCNTKGRWTLRNFCQVIIFLHEVYMVFCLVCFMRDVHDIVDLLFVRVYTG